MPGRKASCRANTFPLPAPSCNSGMEKVSLWNSERRDLGNEKDKIYKLKLIEWVRQRDVQNCLRKKIGGNREDSFSWLKLICQFGWLKDISQNLWDPLLRDSVVPVARAQAGRLQGCCREEGLRLPMLDTGRSGQLWLTQPRPAPTQLVLIRLCTQPVLDAGRNPFHSFRLPERGDFCPFSWY